jgi:putative endonuclease
LASRTLQQRRGAWAEQRALRLLQAQGWMLVSRNWRCPWGELDLIVAKPGRLLLVEVKGRRRSGIDGMGMASLRWPKRQRLAHSWNCWVAAHPAWAGLPVEQVAALVPLPPSRGAVRWIRMGC